MARSEENYIQIHEFNKSNRVQKIKIGNKEISGVEARKLFNLKSHICYSKDILSEFSSTEAYSPKEKYNSLLLKMSFLFLKVKNGNTTPVI